MVVPRVTPGVGVWACSDHLDLLTGCVSSVGVGPAHAAARDTGAWQFTYPSGPTTPYVVVDVVVLQVGLVSPRITLLQPRPS
jgi:hypothetical protein